MQSFDKSIMDIFFNYYIRVFLFETTIRKILICVRLYLLLSRKINNHIKKKKIRILKKVRKMTSLLQEMRHGVIINLLNSLLGVSIIPGVIWVFWHLPLFLPVWRFAVTLRTASHILDCDHGNALQ